MKVTLIDYTADALELLLYTKNTRLKGATTLDDIKAWPQQKKLDELNYMLQTIKSSWEFVNYTFEIEGVTRAFTHQLVRTRTGSYAQEAQRAINAGDHPVLNTIKDGQPGKFPYDDYAREAMSAYEELIDQGVPPQDARGLLPTNITTSIIGQFDLRTLHNMGLLRLCTRAQGEYQKVFKQMRDEVIKVHPWTEDFIQVHCAVHGTCAFPRYTECPIQQYTIDKAGDARAEIQKVWSTTEYEANPVAKDGRAM